MKDNQNDKRIDVVTAIQRISGIQLSQIIKFSYGDSAMIRLTAPSS